MPRDFDFDDIATDRREFIKQDEWDLGESRSYYYAGKEKVQKVSKKTGKPYTQYFIYLLPILQDGSVGEEQTLPLFQGDAGRFKLNGIEPYQEVKLTPVKEQGKNGEYQALEVLGIKNILPEADRPKPKDYPDMQSVSAPSQYKAESASDEIDIDDIPF